MAQSLFPENENPVDFLYVDRKRISSLSGAVVTVASGFREPHGLALEGDALYVSDADNDCIKRVPLATGFPRPF